MPAIPIIEQSTLASQAGLPAGPNNIEGSGLEALGRGISAVGDVVAQNEVRVRRQEIADQSEQALSDLQLRTATKFEDAQQNAAPDVPNFTPDRLKEFESDLRDVTSSLDPQTQRVVRNKALQMKNALAQRALVFEAQTRATTRGLAFDQSTQRRAAAVELDPSQYNTAITQQAEALAGIEMDPIERAQHSELAHTRLTEAAANGIARANPQAALTALATTDSGDPRFDNLTPEARHRVEQGAKAQLVQQQTDHYLGVYQSSGTVAGTQALAALDKAGLPADVTADVRAQVNAGLSQLRTQRREEHAPDLVNVERAIATGTAGSATRHTVDSLYNVGALTPGEQASLQADIDRSQLERAKQGAAADVVRSWLQSSNLPLDPQNEVHRKGLAALFSVDAANSQVGSHDWQSLALAYANRARMVPEQASAWTREAMRSPNPQLAASAAQFYGAISAAAPDATSVFDVPTKAFAGTVNAMIESGTNPNQAVETARANVFETKPETIELRRTQYKQLVKDSDNSLKTYIGHDFGAGWFHSNPTATTDLSADFSSQASRYYEKTGDIDRSRDLAWEDLKRVYGPTQVNGYSAVSAFPVERFGVAPADVRKDVEKVIETFPQSDGSTAQDILVVPDALTLRNVSDALNGRPVRPSYALMTKNNAPVVDDRGIRIRYTVPGGEALAEKIRAAAAAAEAQAQRQVDQARADREDLKTRTQVQLNQQDELH